MKYERSITVQELVCAFSCSPEARQAAASTRRNRTRAFDRFLDRFGKDTPVAAIARPKLYDWRDSFAARPAEGNNTIQAVVQLFNWAVDRSLTRDNPAAGMKPLGPRRSRAEIIWEPEQIEAFLRVATKPVAEVFLTGLWTGLRESDLLSLTTGHFANGWLTVKPQKTVRATGAKVMIPYYLSPVLAPLLTELVNLPWKDGEPIFRTRTGTRWGQRTFHRDFTAVKKAAGIGLVDLTFHDLRGTFITRLLEAGCTDAEVAALTGHSLGGGSIRAYAARTRALAESAYRKLMEKGETADNGNASMAGEIPVRPKAGAAQARAGADDR